MKPKREIELKDPPKPLRGHRLLGNRITSSQQARQMLGRLAGLRSARKQWALGWPNLQKAIAMHRLRCQFKRWADQDGLSHLEREIAWRRVCHPHGKSAEAG